jgi:uncharacterized protein involved in exopolysaccharide biosynthesis
VSIRELLVYWRILKKRLWLVGLLVGVTLGTMLLLSCLSQLVYRATASFQVTTPLPAEVSLYREFRTPSSSEELVRTRNNFVALLQSEFVVGQAVEELGLDLDVDELLEEMVIEPDENSDFINLRVTAPDPKLAAAIANTLLDTASRYFGELSAGSITTGKEFIQQQLQETKDELDRARAALIQFQIENRVGSPSGLLGSQESLVTALKSDRDRALAEGKEVEASSYDEIIYARELELQELILLNSEYAGLQDTAWRIAEVYSDLLDRETEAKLKENEIMSARFVQVVPAREPERSLPRFDVRLLLVGGVVSLIAGVVLAFLLEALEGVPAPSDGSVSASPREQVLGAPVK